MKTLAFTLWAAATIVALSPSLHSQLPAAPRPTLQVLQQIKAQNAALIEKQAATLVHLDQVSKEAEQIKFLSKRS